MGLSGLVTVFVAGALLVFLAMLFLYEQFQVALAIMCAPLQAVGGVSQDYGVPGKA